MPNNILRNLQMHSLGNEVAFVRANLEIMRLQTTLVKSIPGHESFGKSCPTSQAIAGLSAYASSAYEALYLPGYADAQVISLLELAHSLYDTELALAALGAKEKSPCPELDALLATIKRFEAAAKAAPSAS